MSYHDEQIAHLREIVVSGDNHLCFVEREQLLPRLTEASQEIAGEFRYSWVLAKILESISTPIDDADVILGRMVEGPTRKTDAEIETTRWQDFCHQSMLIGPGHLTLDFEELLREGLHGIARKARANAERLRTNEARVLADNAEQCACAVESFATRYAAAARTRAAQLEGIERENLLRAAVALEQVPHGPSFDFFSALQSVWFVHMLVSCIIGGRDYAFGRMDQYLLPFYRRDVACGLLDHDTAVWMSANFMMKTNEITGTASQHFKPKPIPSAGNKQYLIIGGASVDSADDTNELSEVWLDAAVLCAMPEPVIVARLAEATNPAFLEKAAAAACAAQGIIHFMNDRTFIPGLMRKGVAPADAYDYTARGCSTVDIPARTACHDEFLDATGWFMASLCGGRNAGTDGVHSPGVLEPTELRTFDDVLAAFSALVHQAVKAIITANNARTEPYWECSFTNDGGAHFHFDALLLRDCVAQGRLYCAGALRYVVRVHHFMGLATITDSLMAIKRLVYDQGRMTLPELLAACEANFVGYEALRNEILLHIPKFGNDIPEVDEIAGRVAAILRDAVDAVTPLPRHILISSLYSLLNHNAAGASLMATPNGRLAGEPVSENHSPTYGMDYSGTTALMNSLRHLPFAQMPSGGLNVKFAFTPEPSVLASLLKTFFSMGGAVIGFTFVSRTTLEDARLHPERYRSLLVRQTGFSEYFNALPDFEQLELINRTEH